MSRPILNKIPKTITCKFDSRTLYNKGTEIQCLSHNGEESRPQSRPNNTGKLLEEFNKILSDMTVTPYKKAKLYTAGNNINKHWYDYYYYRHPQTNQFVRFKERFNINRIDKLKDRIKYGNTVVEVINEQLESGFNPFNYTIAEPAESELKIELQLNTIVSGLCINASKTSVATYREIYNRFIKFINEKKLNSITIDAFTVDHVKQLKKWMLHEKDLSVKTCNNTLSHLGMFWDYALEQKTVYKNCFKSTTKAKKRDKVISKSKRFEPLTNDEINTIFQALTVNKLHNFKYFLAFIYYSWSRPIELMRLKIADIEFERQLIRFKKGETKNSDAAYVQIVPPLMDLIKKMKLQNYPATHYIFSDDFAPGMRLLNKSLPSKYWRNIVKNTLKINKDMYALKHTGNIEYLLNNKGATDLKWQQMQNRHSSSAMTDRYNRSLGVYFVEMKNIQFRII